MRSRWVTLLKRYRPRETRYKHSLIRNVLIVLLLVSLIPILLVGTLNFFRTRNMLTQQASRQLEGTAQAVIEQLMQIVNLRTLMIEHLVTDQI